ncbi:MAG: polymerase subunit sigma-70 [Brevibacillus sp.]|jgi:TolA-binding protein|nr:polymerase subunit sigma-70 [Brevibacillus sp.]
MDVVYIILIGVGVLSMAVALFVKAKPASDFDTMLPTHRTTDKAELEKTLQLMGRQIKQDKDLMQRQLDQSHEELLIEVKDLRQRLEQLENGRGRQQIQQVRENVQQEATIEKPEEDVLVLRERYRRVFELQREGLALDEIAKRLGAGRGEIDLIFALAAKNERGMADA